LYVLRDDRVRGLLWKRHFLNVIKGLSSSLRSAQRACPRLQLWAHLEGRTTVTQPFGVTRRHRFFLFLREGLSRFFHRISPDPGGNHLYCHVFFLPQGLLGFARRWLNRYL
jgi:hypothetical protein